MFISVDFGSGCREFGFMRMQHAGMPVAGRHPVHGHQHVLRAVRAAAAAANQTQPANQQRPDQPNEEG